MQNPTQHDGPSCVFQRKVNDWPTGSIMSNMIYTPSDEAKGDIVDAIEKDLRYQKDEIVTIEVAILVNVTTIRRCDLDKTPRPVSPTPI